ncbi:MAG: MarR family transcriptional regulator [Anaerolineae bacterium]|nr:MarR family transcriptional regulator [Anaerolineae bacterium]
MSKDEVAEQVYNFIRAYFKAHGFAPSLRDISEGCYMSPSNVVRYLDKLEARGWISREMRKPRSIALIEHEEV